MFYFHFLPFFFSFSCTYSLSGSSLWICASLFILSYWKTRCSPQSIRSDFPPKGQTDHSWSPLRWNHQESQYLWSWGRIAACRALLPACPTRTAPVLSGGKFSWWERIWILEIRGEKECERDDAWYHFSRWMVLCIAHSSRYKKWTHDNIIVLRNFIVFSTAEMFSCVQFSSFCRTVKVFLREFSWEIRVNGENFHSNFLLSTIFLFFSHS